MSAELPFPVTVEIKGITKAATFARLPDALDAVRTSLAQLPLDDDQAGYLADLFSPASAERIAHQLVQVGAVRAIAFLGIEPHPIYLCPARE
ncbi:hypothetical protein F7Q99_02685 [Streptomyces kaniharaensis]|uniref:Uncharacterized protein n=1 Tax=Streptomyces kaniharaensis TaxID=212423 RepID=A0A6N7KIA5_9ACTN|nr:hypothetical protein [Streptomyces kaniharaensis]MQS11220.1 hypothetical protein [Streptomyces kaniharaensis]